MFGNKEETVFTMYFYSYSVHFINQIQLLRSRVKIEQYCISK